MGRYLAVDLGAESGKIYLGGIYDGRLESEEIHRFENVPVRVPDGLYWDALHILHEIKLGLREAARRGLDGIGICTWGVDFGLLDRDGRLIGNPMHYRDSRTEKGMRLVAERADRAEIYGYTGIQFMPINTLNQFAAMLEEPQLEIADALLLMPDLFNYWLTGRKSSERTFASTTQMYDVTKRDWSWELIRKMGFPSEVFQDLIDPGTTLGPLLDDVRQETGLDTAPSVIATASHDTASAVVAVPISGPETAYISSGTWSLVGVELPNPVISDAARQANVTNEEGFAATTRLLKNVMGLWILQETRRMWAERGDHYTYEELVALARDARPFGFLIDPDDASFLPPGNMPERMHAFHERTGQETPSSVGEIVRCILESLALKYRWVIEKLEELSNRPISTINVVGGGARNHVLNQMVSDATGCPVSAGPTEATATGNVLVQAFAAGEVSSLEEMRHIARSTTELDTYEPSSRRAIWDEAYQRFLQILGSA